MPTDTPGNAIYITIQKELTELKQRLYALEQASGSLKFDSHKKRIEELINEKGNCSVADIEEMIGLSRQHCLKLMKKIAEANLNIVFVCGDFESPSLLVKAGEATIDLQLYANILKNVKKGSVLQYSTLRKAFEKIGAKEITEKRVQSLVSRLVSSRKFNVLFNIGDNDFWERTIKRIK